jgi:uncharacterized protein
MVIAGIDFGSKLSGNTAVWISYEKDTPLGLHRTSKNQNADEFLLDLLLENHVEMAYIDAPLSLPIYYRQPEKNPEFFYRKSDKILGAMSPMFLGGLTARAMKLGLTLKENGVMSTEVYPSALQKQLFPHWKEYKKEKEFISEYQNEIQKLIPSPIPILSKDWHEIDGLLALLTGIRHQAGIAIPHGDEEEGLIWV